MLLMLCEKGSSWTPFLFGNNTCMNMFSSTSVWRKPISQTPKLVTKNKNWTHVTSYTKNEGHNELASINAPSIGCLLLLSCGWTSTELIFGFTFVTNYVGNRSHA
jgi:hypothetical protein